MEKIHFGYPILPLDTKYETLCGRSKFNHGFTSNSCIVTCLKCISKMPPIKQVWHDKNNSEWIEHKLKDGRR